MDARPDAKRTLIIGSKPFRSTYYDDRMRASPALLRTRAPYLVKNTITGLAICTLVVGICMLPPTAAIRPSHLFADTYTINAISQDEFDDVIVPDEPMRQPAQQLSGGTTQAVQQALDARK